jgi:hypothetical protein
VCGGILASHSLYHIDKDLQEKAVQELLRTLSERGRLLIFYANPKRQLPLGGHLRIPIPPAKVFPDIQPMHMYSYLHSLKRMLTMLSSHQRARVTAKPLCLLTQEEMEVAFRSGLGALWFWVFLVLQEIYRNSPRVSYYLAYIVTRH